MAGHGQTLSGLAHPRQNAGVEPWPEAAAESIRPRLEAALERPIDRPSDWRVELVARPAVAGLPTRGLWRVGGDGWSVVVKALAHGDAGNAQWASHADPDHPYYWKREALAYESALLQGLRHGIRAPVCYGVTEDADGSVAVWMEDVARSGIEAAQWNLEAYAEAARRLGVMQARLAQTDLTTETWLSRDYLRTYVERRLSEAFPDAGTWNHPAVRAVLGGGRAEAFRRLWSDGRRALTELETLPLTFCHLDLHPANMFSVDRGAAPDAASTPLGDIVVIDWAFAGLGRIGEDTSTLLIDAVADFHVAAERLADLCNVLVGGYAAGLTEGGLRLGERDVRRAVALGAVARYFWLPAALARALADGRPTLNGRAAAEAAPGWAEIADLLLELAASIR